MKCNKKHFFFLGSTSVVIPISILFFLQCTLILISILNLYIVLIVELSFLVALRLILHLRDLLLSYLQIFFSENNVKYIFVILQIRSPCSYIVNLILLFHVHRTDIFKINLALAISIFLYIAPKHLKDSGIFVLADNVRVSGHRKDPTIAS